MAMEIADMAIKLLRFTFLGSLLYPTIYTQNFCVSGDLVKIKRFYFLELRLNICISSYPTSENTLENSRL
jgi:hypothetical protein